MDRPAGTVSVGQSADGSSCSPRCDARRYGLEIVTTADGLPADVQVTEPTFFAMLDRVKEQVVPDTTVHELGEPPTLQVPEYVDPGLPLVTVTVASQVPLAACWALPLKVGPLVAADTVTDRVVVPEAPPLSVTVSVTG